RQARLADARLAPEQHHPPAPAEGGIERGAQLLDLVVAPDERDRRHGHWRAGRTRNDVEALLNRSVRLTSSGGLPPPGPPPGFRVTRVVSGLPAALRRRPIDSGAHPGDQLLDRVEQPRSPRADMLDATAHGTAAEVGIGAQLDDERPVRRERSPWP